MCQEYNLDIDYVLWGMPIAQVFKGLFLIQQGRSDRVLKNRTDKTVQKRWVDEVIKLKEEYVEK